MGAKVPRPLQQHPTDPTACLVQLTKGYVAVIDVFDAPYVGQFNWCAKEDHKAVYATAWIGGRNVLLHRFIWEMHSRPATRLVDHEDGDGLNDRLDNLRAANTSQNTANRNASALSRTGVRGVAPVGGRWRVRLKHEGKEVHVGYFGTVEAAIVARNEAALALHGPFAREHSL